MKSIIGLCLLLVIPASMAGNVIVLVPASSPTIGSAFSIDVSVTGIADLYAFQFDLSFDPTLLSAVSVTEGDFLASGGTTVFIPGAIDNVGGTVNANADALIGAITGVTGGGILAEFDFTALAAGTSPLSFANVILLNSSLSDITANTAFDNGSVTISAPVSSAVPEPSTLSLALCAMVACSLGMVATRQKKRSCGLTQARNHSDFFEA